MIRTIVIAFAGLTYLAVGIAASGHAARAAYRWDRAKWPGLASGNPREGLNEAVSAVLTVLLAWPLVAIFICARFILRATVDSFGRAVENSIPEYRVERDRELAAELALKIKRQQAEIARLEREIQGWSP